MAARLDRKTNRNGCKGVFWGDEWRSARHWIKSVQVRARNTSSFWGSLNVLFIRGDRRILVRDAELRVCTMRRRSRCNAIKRRVKKRENQSWDRPRVRVEQNAYRAEGPICEWGQQRHMRRKPDSTDQARLPRQSFYAPCALLHSGSASRPRHARRLRALASQAFCSR